jgi:hypothetical protein
MPLVKSEVLSQDHRFPFGNSISSFFEKYDVKETVSCYYFYPWPEECDTGTCGRDLFHINYSTDIVLWAPMDSFIDQRVFNYYLNKKTREFQKIEQICNYNSNRKFILIPNFYNLDNWVESSNLFSVNNTINTKFRVKYKRCDHKTFTHKKWVCLNNRSEPHRTALISYLLLNDLDKSGNITCSDKILSNCDMGDILKYFRFKDSNILKSFIRLKNDDFDRYISKPFPKETFVNTLTDEVIDDCIDNYQENLFPIYQHTALEIISCSIFSEPTPLLGEKEIQSVYAKNFPIFIGSKGIAKVFKNIWGMDIFEDIVNHDYDEIDDPTERLTAAIDLNLHLLDGSSPIDELWRANQHRFNANCDRMDLLLYDEQYQQNFDHERIKLGFNHFGIQLVNRFE